MEKRIETVIAGIIFPAQVFQNEWALWKKGLRRSRYLTTCNHRDMNEWALWKKGLRPAHQLLPMRLSSPNEWALWKKGLRHFHRRYSVAIARVSGNEWALWKKGLRPYCFKVITALLTWMNEPYGKKDWDLEPLRPHLFPGQSREWMSLMEKRIETKNS